MGLFDNLLAQTPQASTTPQSMTPEIIQPAPKSQVSFIHEETTPPLATWSENNNILISNTDIFWTPSSASAADNDSIIIQSEEMPLTHTQTTDDILNLANGNIDGNINYAELKEAANTPQSSEKDNTSPIVSDTTPQITGDTPTTDSADFWSLFTTDNHINVAITPEDTTANVIAAEAESAEKTEEAFHFLDEKTTIPEQTITPEPAISQEVLENTDDFITLSLSRLENMLSVIDTKKQKHLDQAEAYKTEKEALALKEKEENALAREMDAERGRIESMQAYFRNETHKKNPENHIEDSVNTALAGIAVKDSVEKAVKSPVRKTKEILKEAA